MTTMIITIVKFCLILNAILIAWFVRPVRGVSVMRTYPTPIGFSTVRPTVDIPKIDRAAMVANANRIAATTRPHVENYRQALAYGFRTAWERGKVGQSFAMLRAQVKPQGCTAADLEASRRATRRVGSSFT